MYLSVTSLIAAFLASAKLALISFSFTAVSSLICCLKLISRKLSCCSTTFSKTFGAGLTSGGSSEAVSVA